MSLICTLALSFWSFVQHCILNLAWPLMNIGDVAHQKPLQPGTFAWRNLGALSVVLGCRCSGGLRQGVLSCGASLCAFGSRGSLWHAFTARFCVHLCVCAFACVCVFALVRMCHHACASVRVRACEHYCSIRAAWFCFV